MARRELVAGIRLHVGIPFKRCVSVSCTLHASGCFPSFGVLSKSVTKSAAC